MVAGDVVNTASRLQTAAPVNGDPRRRGHLPGDRAGDRVPRRRRRSTRRARPSRSRSGRWWRRARASASDVAPEPRTPLVGRERELELLRGALARARHERSPQLVTLVGVPGIGKTRLVQELFAGGRGRSGADLLAPGPLPALRRRAWRCWALGEIVKAHAGVLEGDPAESATRKLGARRRGGRPRRTEAAWIERHLRPLLGLGDGRPRRGPTATRASPPGGGSSRRSPSAARSSSSSRISTGPTKGCSTSSTTSSTGRRTSRSSSSPPRVRSCLRAGRSGAGGSRTRRPSRSSPLKRRRDGDASSTACSTAPCCLPSCSRRSSERSGGNPLYAEEFARIALERGTSDGGADLPLPDTVQGLIAARLDSVGGQREGAAPGRRSGRQGVLARRGHGARRRRRPARVRGPPARPRAEGVRAPRASLGGRGRHSVRLLPRARPRRGVRADPTRPTGRRSISGQPSGSSRWAGPRPTPTCGRTTI